MASLEASLEGTLDVVDDGLPLTAIPKRGRLPERLRSPSLRRFFSSFRENWYEDTTYQYDSLADENNRV
jgi:hypothetical protein